ncbi:SSI family serine proteinase inhibitor [Streptomyces sp. NPDC052225]|uniref:SSI family serine proteinase inhibitor n=1 Tax=Streptomyces sp. NPDC052225 TaxID=3154949 RepID=UPI0034142F95
MALVSVTKARGTLLAAAAACALLGAAAGTTQAAPQESLPGNWVYLSVMEGDGVLGDMEGTLLRCPAHTAAGHPYAAAACRELAAAKGDINRIPVQDTACLMIYKPVTAVAYGMWDGRRVAYARDFSNECVLHASTGSVFKTDD